MIEFCKPVSKITPRLKKNNIIYIFDTFIGIPTKIQAQTY